VGGGDSGMAWYGLTERGAVRLRAAAPNQKARGRGRRRAGCSGRNVGGVDAAEEGAGLAEFVGGAEAFGGNLGLCFGGDLRFGLPEFLAALCRRCVGVGCRSCRAVGC